MDDEPAENISGGARGGGRADEFAPGTADTRAEAVVDRLGERYWQKTYGGRDAFECLVRTVLSQNTSDTASQPAHDGLMDRYGQRGPASEGDLAVSLANAELSALAETISSAGLYNQKSKTLVRLGKRIVDEYGSAGRFDEFLKNGDPDEVRDALLDMKGVGPKTADCVLLFSGGRAGVFPVDTHVHRIARRMGLAPASADHETVRARLERDVSADKCCFGPEKIAKRYNSRDETEKSWFHNGETYEVDGEEITFSHGGVPPEKCGFGHTTMIQFGREYCTARKPACLDGPEACPLFDLCDRVGVDLESGEVVDPARTISGDNPV